MCFARFYQSENYFKKTPILACFFLFFYLSPESVSIQWQNLIISRWFLSPFTKVKIPYKMPFLVLARLFKTCLHKIYQNACKSLISKCFLLMFRCNYQIKKIHTKMQFLTLFFFLFVSTKCLKTDAKCIHFKTVFACVLHAFTKVKITFKNFFFQICLLKVSQNACKI